MTAIHGGAVVDAIEQSPIPGRFRLKRRYRLGVERVGALGWSGHSTLVLVVGRHRWRLPRSAEHPAVE